VLQYQEKEANFIESNLDLLKRLAGVSSCQQVKASEGLKLTQADVAAWLDIPEHIARAYAAKLSVKVKTATELTTNLKKRLSNKSYAQNAPAAVVAQTKQQLEDAEAHLALLKAEQKRYA